MTTDRYVRIIAGLMILITLALAHLTGQANLGQLSWLWLTAFIGLNLFQSGITRFCPLDSILAKMGVRRAT
ncbi:MAG: YgaP family membrane protein [Guyparkeria sp.]|uniref:YgaP family membrane protein n=1 Tax=Guyparkeria sp. TaxID=2035736 RepID=UPI00397E472B